MNIRQDLLTLAWPIAGVVAISTIFLVRGFRGNIRHFSTFGHFASAWPLIIFPYASILGLSGIFCLPIGLILALIAAGLSIAKKQNFGDLIAIPVNIVWIALIIPYAINWWTLVSD